MYLKLSTKRKLVDLGKLIAPKLPEEELNWDYENVYEWIDFKVPELKLGLNISREHGMANLTDEEIDECEREGKNIEQILEPGDTYITGTFDSALKPPEELFQHIANTLDSKVLVFEGEHNVEETDSHEFITLKPIT